MANKYMQRYSTSGKYKSKPQYHPKHVRMAMNSNNNPKRKPVFARMWRKWNPCILSVQLLRKTVGKFFQKSIELPYDPLIPLLSTFPKELKKY